MKRILSIILSLSMILGILVVPAFAYDNNRNKGRNSNNSVQKALNKAQTDLQKVMNEKVKLEAIIQKEIVKMNNSSVKPATDAVATKAKWQAEIDKAVAQDVTETANFEAAVVKYNAEYQTKQTALTTKLANITTDYNKQLSDLNIKITATTDAVAKQNFTTAITNITNYVNIEKAAITAYSVSLQTIFTNKQGIFTAQRNELKIRQDADIAYLRAMTAAKILELDNKLLTQSQVVPVPVNVEATIRAKYKVQTDLIAISIANLNSLITALKLNLGK